MLVMGVIDVRGGLAVHARGGRREEYAPVTRVGPRAIASGSVRELSRALATDLGVQTLYMADLDAIDGGPVQDPLVATAVGAGAPVWLDAGISTVEHARTAWSLAVARVVVGLETLTSFEALGDIAKDLGGANVAFSLDLRHGRPLTRGGSAIRDAPAQIAVRARDAGASSVIVLDLARVGAGHGPDTFLIEQVRAAVPDVMLLAGGGLRDLRDLRTLAEAGCDGALLASALLDGHMGAAEVSSARRLDRGPGARRPALT
jgi:phosphoribosylformimino-5-aminoimidazole carboxamide ribotide isomerase